MVVAYASKHVQSIEKERDIVEFRVTQACDLVGKSLIKYIVRQGERLKEVRGDLDKEEEGRKRHIRVYGETGAPTKLENITMMIS